ncbi:retention module-containing protein [Chitinibacteraceae bacterium HSL-7]
MAAQIGTVKVVNGTVTAKDASGQVRTLAVGDKVYQGETIQTLDGASIAIALANGRIIDLGRNSEFALDDDVLGASRADAAPAAQPADAPAPSQTDIEAIQQQIAQGADPTQLLQASAAGPGAGAGGGADEGGSSFVVVDFANTVLNPTAGFETGTFEATLISLEDQSEGLVGNNPPDAIDDNATGASDDLLTTGEDNALVIQLGTLLANDVDPDGDPLTIIAVGNAVNGTVALVNGQIVFTPDPNYNGPASFTYTVDDGNGATDTATVNIIVTPVNDPPVANDDNATDAANDALTTPEDTPLNIAPATLLANDVDIDGDTLTIIAVDNPTHGTVQLVNGQIIFTPDPDYNGPASFTYTITDGNGATDTATVNINVTPVDDPIIIRGLDNEGGEQTVLEANLADGSSPDNAALTQSGTFSVVAPDGFAGLTIDGMAMINADGTLTGNTLVTPLGTLVITSFDGTNVGYSYTLSDNTAHPDGAGSNSVFDSMTVTVTDADGDTASDSLDIRIVDDLPVAMDDNHAIVEDDESTFFTSGNVLTNDEGYADGKAGTVVWAAATASDGDVSDYGTLVLNADGSYTFDLDNGSAAVQGLAGGEVVTISVDYTMEDTDGDPSMATLTIMLTGSNDGVTITGLVANGPDEVVYEANLPDGSDPNNAALTQSGVFNVSTPDGFNGLDVNGTLMINADGSLTGASVSTDRGTLTITSFDGTHVGYSYVLDAADTHADGGGNNELMDSFTVTVYDTDSDSASDTIDIVIVDDLPMAVDDSRDVSEDGILHVDGNVLTNDEGYADGKAGTVVWAAATASDGDVSDYGTLVLNADGSYTFDLDNGSAAVQGLAGGEVVTISVDYTMEDTDGDPSMATLTITLTGSNDGVTITGLVANGPDEVVYEANLPDGSDPNNAALTQSGVFNVSTPDGFNGLDVNGTLMINADGSLTGASVSTDRGTLTITSFDGTHVGYSYVLDAADTHADGGGINELMDSFTVTVYDTDSDSASDTIDIVIVDDLPMAVDDSRDVSEDGILHVDGNVLTNDEGYADGKAGTVVWAAATASDGDVSDYGTLVLNADGSYTFDLDNGSAAVQGLAGGEVVTISVDYTMEDTDGDPSMATLTITLTGSNDGVTITGLVANGPDEVVYEANLPDGSDPNNAALTQSGVFNVSTPDGFNGLDVNGTLMINADGSLTGASVSTDRGTLTITSFDGTHVGYSYVLDAADTHADGGGNNELMDSFTVTVYDTDSDSASDTIDIVIVDDLPMAVDDSRDVSEDGILHVDGNVLTNDEGYADGKAGTVVWAAATASDGDVSDYGTLVLNADGSYTFDLDNGSAAVQGLAGGEVVTISVDYTMEDTDGDPSMATLTIMLTGSNDGVTITGLVANGPDEVVYEANLPDGSDPNNAALTQSGVFNVSTPDGFNGLDVNGTLMINADGSLTGASVSTDRGTLTITSFDGTHVGYSYVLDAADTHADGGGNNELMDSFTVTVYDTDSDSASDTIDIVIVDDLPMAVDDVLDISTHTETVNLVLVLDSSASIGSSNMQIIKDAVSHLMDEYGGALVNVMLVDFDGDARVLTTDGRVWLTQAEAEAHFSEISSGGNTDYDDALAAVIGNFGTPPAADQTYVYFISDGEPYGSDGSNSNSIDSTERAAWVNFLESTGIDGVYAIGIGSGVSQTDSDLLDVAWSPSGNHAGNVVLISGADDLAATLTQLSGGSGNVISNDIPGADGLGSPHLLSVSYDADGMGGNAPANYVFDAGHTSYVIDLGPTRGTFTIFDDGHYQFVASTQADGAPFSIQYTMVDADGDPSTASLWIDLNATPVASSGSVIVSEEGLPHGLSDNSGTTDTTNNNSATGQIVVTDGDSSDSHSFSLGQPSATLRSDGVALTWSGIGTTVLTGQAGGVDIVRVEFTDSEGHYTVTLLGQLDHPSTGLEDVLNFSIPVTVSDGVASTVTSISVSIEDDSPISHVSNGLVFNGAGAMLHGTLADIGADWFGAHTELGGTAPTGLTSNGASVYYELNTAKDTLTAKASVPGPDTVVFTLHANADGSYVFEQFAAMDLSKLSVNLTGSTSAGGPNAYYITPTGTFTSLLPTDWAVKITGTDASGTTSSVNPHTGGMGVGNAHLENLETMRFEFDDEGASGGANAVTRAVISYKDLNDPSGPSIEQLHWTAHFTDGSTTDGYANGTSAGTGSITINAPTGWLIDFVDVQATNGSKAQLTNLTTYSQDTDATKDLTFTFKSVDGDGDQTTGSFTVTIAGEHNVSADASHTALGGSALGDILTGNSMDNILTGGAGDNTLTGNGGADTFHLDGAGTDTITDFHSGEGDSLNVHDLLTGFGTDLAAALDGNAAGGELSVADGGGGNTLLQFTPEGGSTMTVAVLQGVAYDGDLLNQLLATHQITDQ